MSSSSTTSRSTGSSGSTAITTPSVAAPAASVPSATKDADDEGSKYPPIQPGGSLIIAWQIRNKPVLVVGGGHVAATRLVSLLNADAHIHVVCPRSGLCPEVQYRIKTQPSITYHPQTFHPSLLESLQPSLVLTAIDDPAASSSIYRLCHSLRIPVNVADVPPECDFYFGSVHRDGPLQVMVSTNGNGPKLANLVRRRIAESLPVGIGDAVVKVGQLRRRLRKVAPKIEDGNRRMEWMSRLCEQWTLKELCRLDDALIEEVLKGYQEGRVPRYRDVAPKEAVEEEEEEAVEEELREGPDQDGVFREALECSFGWM